MGAERLVNEEGISKSAVTPATAFYRKFRTIKCMITSISNVGIHYTKVYF